MVSCLHNAYNDVVRERVLVADWHMQTFYLYLKKLHALIDETLKVTLCCELGQAGAQRA